MLWSKVREKYFSPKFLKFELFAVTQVAITLKYMHFTNFLTWGQLETYINDTPWWLGSMNDVINGHKTLPGYAFWCAISWNLLEMWIST